MSLRDLLGNEPEVTDEPFEDTNVPSESPEASDEEPEVSPEADEEDFLTSADIDPRLIVRSVQVDTAEEEFRAQSAAGFDSLIEALRAEERPYRVINRFTGKVYDSFLDFVPDQAEE